MALVSDTIWLQAINAIGGEDFDTGYPSYLRGVFFEEYVSVQAGEMVIDSSAKGLRCRTSDVTTHSLVKQSKIRRVSDDATYFVRRFEPADGGMTLIVLSR
jgi:hypothetical protein